MEIAADERRPAAASPETSSRAPDFERDAVAEHLDLAAGLPRPLARRIERAAHLRAAARGREHDLAVDVGDARRLDDAARVDDVVEHRLGRGRGQQHLAAGRGDRAGVFDQRAPPDSATGPVVAKLKRASPTKSTANVSAPASATVPSCASISPSFRTDGAASSTVPARHFDLAAIDDAGAFFAWGVEIERHARERHRGRLGCRQHEAGRRDRAARSDGDAGGVDQDDLAVGRERSEQQGRSSAALRRPRPSSGPSSSIVTAAPGAIRRRGNSTTASCDRTSMTRFRPGSREGNVAGDDERCMRARRCMRPRARKRRRGNDTR